MFTESNFFINSPLESVDMPAVVSILSDIRFLLVIILYFLGQLTLTLAFRIFLSEPLNLDKFSRLIPGFGIGFNTFICNWLTRYINVLQSTSNFWLVFILFCMFMFLSVSIFSVNRCVTALSTLL